MANHHKSEAEARVLIDRRLEALGWRSIWRETAPVDYYRDKLGRARPDYVLCRADSEQPMAVVEAKRAGRDLAAALRQGRAYAKKLGCNMVFASDGMLTLTAHVADGKALMINNEEVRDFLSEDVLRNFEKSRIWDRQDVIKSSQKLISIFNASSKLLRAEGMVNIDAFAEFSQILFFKIVSEIDVFNHEKNLDIRWGELENCYGSHLLESYKAALTYLNRKYPGVFSVQVEIKNPMTLEKIIAQLKKYSFLEVKEDIKGNAYEYFLRQYNRQKNELAQYFTPRHVVAMMVGLADPKFGERVYDPFCGTGGMLIEAFRYLKQNMQSKRAVDQDRLQKHSVFGADISRSASAAKMNMILAGDGHSNITRADSLKINNGGEYDVVITNIPFVSADEKAFIRHCFSAAAQRPGGRVCIIVPERVIDQHDYADVRAEILMQWDIRRIISLPREVFRGVTSAKTSVIYALWRGESDVLNKCYHIPYIKVENDGYTRDTKRDPLPGKNDLDDVIETRHAEVGGHDATHKNGYTFKAAPKKSIASPFKFTRLRELVRVRNETIKITADMMCRDPGMSGKNHQISLKEERFGYNVKVKNRKLIHPGDLVFSRLHTQNGLFAYSADIFHGTSTHLVCNIDETKVDRHFLFHTLDGLVPHLSKEDTTGRENYSEEDILELKIPLPALSEQRKIVANLKAACCQYVAAQSRMENAKAHFSQSILKH